MLLQVKNSLLSVWTTDATHRLLEVEPLNKTLPQMNGIYPVQHKKRNSGIRHRFSDGLHISQSKQIVLVRYSFEFIVWKQLETLLMLKQKTAWSFFS